MITDNFLFNVRAINHHLLSSNQLNTLANIADA